MHDRVIKKKEEDKITVPLAEVNNNKISISQLFPWHISFQSLWFIQKRNFGKCFQGPAVCTPTWCTGAIVPLGRQVRRGWSSHTKQQELSLMKMKKKKRGHIWKKGGRGDRRQQTSCIRWAALKELVGIYRSKVGWGWSVKGIGSSLWTGREAETS